MLQQVELMIRVICIQRVDIDWSIRMKSYDIYIQLLFYTKLPDSN